MRTSVAILNMLAIVVGVVASCAPADMDMPDPAEGADLFNKNCAACHGKNAVLSTRDTGVIAPDLNQIVARNGGVFPRAAVLSQIDGYGKGQAGAAQMPEFGSLLEGDLVPVEVEGVFTPTPRPLAALLAYLESIQN